MTTTDRHPGGARSRNSDRWDTSGRIYERDGKKYTSVTTLLGDGLPKPALTGWAAKMTAEYAAANPGATVQEMKEARFAVADEAASRGTAMHKWAERWALDMGTAPPEDDPALAKMVDQWLALVIVHRIQVQATEFTIYNETLGYAGTADGVALIDFPDKPQVPTLFDIKTGKDVYPDAALQLCALAHGEYIGIHNGPTLPMPEFERCVVVHVRPTFARIVPVDVGEWSWRTFRAARAISEWTQGPAKAAVLPAIEKEDV